MPVVKWIDRITDVSNTWLNAYKMEAARNYADAIILYLDDAAESLRRGSLVRAGLSCSCAADCLVKFRVDALPKKLYFMAATVYRENANSASHRSIREWLWSLQKAYENFLLAGETSMARAVHGEYMVLAKRVQPSIREAEPLALKSDSTSSATPAAMDLPERVVNAVKVFLEQEIVPLKYGSRGTAAGSRNG